MFYAFCYHPIPFHIFCLSSVPFPFLITEAHVLSQSIFFVLYCCIYCFIPYRPASWYDLPSLPPLGIYRYMGLKMMDGARVRADVCKRSAYFAFIAESVSLTRCCVRSVTFLRPVPVLQPITAPVFDFDMAVKHARWALMIRLLMFAIMIAVGE